MSIRSTLVPVEEQIRTVCRAAGEQVPNFGFGEADVARQESPPRIVWVRKSAQRSRDWSTGGLPRTLMPRTVLISAHVWHKTDDDLDGLIVHIDAALYLILGAYEYVSEDFTPSFRLGLWPARRLLLHGVVSVARRADRHPRERIRADRARQRDDRQWW